MESSSAIRVTDVDLLDGLLSESNKVSYRKHEDWDHLQRKTEMIVRKVFGNDSTYIQDLKQIKYRPSGPFFAGIKVDWETPFEKGLKKFRTLLSVMIEDKKLGPLNTTTPIHLDDDNHTQFMFVDANRISELENLTHPQFDFRRLLTYCKELNDNYERSNYLSAAMLGRSILDHVPPVFGCATFDQVVGTHGGKSFKKSMDHLNTSMRSIADSYLHLQIRKKETVPNATQVNFSQDMDVLLAEVIRKTQEG